MCPDDGSGWRVEDADWSNVNQSALGNWASGVPVDEGAVLVRGVRGAGQAGRRDEGVDVGGVVPVDVVWVFAGMPVDSCVNVFVAGGDDCGSAFPPLQTGLG